MAVIEAKDVGYKAGDRYLLKDISWTAAPGENWLVFGQNGCGKTTLLSILAGYKQQTHGQVKLFGETLSEENILALRQRIGWVSGSFFDRYYHQEAVLDIVLAGLTGTFSRGDRIDDQSIRAAKAALAKQGILVKQDMPFDLLSKGERQAVLMARALLHPTEVLILDEPGTGLDVLARERMLAEVSRLAQNKEQAVIYVTQHVEEIQPIFDHCLLLKNGRIFAAGLTEAVFTSEVLSRFLEAPVQLIKPQQGSWQLLLEEGGAAWAV